jgi:hypothetical protein
MSEYEFVDEEWVRKFLGYSVQTMRNKQCRGEMPKPIQHGKERRYLKKDFFDWYLGRDQGKKKKAS